jgi:pyruvate kinase
MTPHKSAPVTTPEDAGIKAVLRELLFLRSKMVAAQAHLEGVPIHPDHSVSARNLLSYLALRRHDIRALQVKLAKLGLSSLGRCEANVIPSVDRVIEVLQRLTSETDDGPGTALAGEDEGESLLRVHTEKLFGADAPQRGARIMVTMPSEAASNSALVMDLLHAGMDCQRINCAHDSPETWLQMIHQVQRAQRSAARTCSIMMDLAGPKLRTGAIDAQPPILRVRPTRNALGRVIAPARVWLYRGERDSAGLPESVTVSQGWLSGLRVGDLITFRDARESKRMMKVAEVLEEGCWVELSKTAYLIPGLTLNLKNRKGRKKSGELIQVTCRREPSIRLQEGDTLILNSDVGSGKPGVRGDGGELLEPAVLGCTLPSIFADVKPGQPIWFDDGKIGGVLEKVEEHALHVLITHAPGGAKLKSDKGINLPDSQLRLEALAPADIQAMEFACKHADVIQMSFVNSAADVQSLISHLARLDALDMGVVLKIETRSGFENIAELLMAGMQLPKLGVMIARGDLAIENGFERTAELQEELLCICEAAHVPVIWATQVLETLAKKGSPSRAEITDAAMGARAECVMLNKGPHIVKAVACLDDILSRMREHRCKKNDLMRELRVARSPVPC